MSVTMTLAVTVMVIGFAAVCMAAALWTDTHTRKTSNQVGFFGLMAFACGLGVILVTLTGPAPDAGQTNQVPVDGPGVVQQDAPKKLSV